MNNRWGIVSSSDYCPESDGSFYYQMNSPLSIVKPWNEKKAVVYAEEVTFNQLKCRLVTLGSVLLRTDKVTGLR